MDLLEDLVVPGVGELGKTAVNAFLTQRAAAYNQRMNEKNMARNFKYSQMAQANAAANEVAGMKRAGLNPALANGAAAAPIAASNNGTAQAVQFDPANLLLMSQIRKTNAEAEDKEIDNTRKKSHDSALSMNLERFFTKLAADTSDDELRDFFNAQADFAGTGKANVGNYQALLQYFDLQGKPEEAIERKFDKKLSAWLSELRWSRSAGKTFDDPFVKALGSLDARQSDFVAAQAAKLMAEKKGVDQEIELTKAKINLTNEQIEQVKQAAKAMENANVMQYIEKEEYGKALLAMLLQVFSGVASRGVAYVK